MPMAGPSGVSMHHAGEHAQAWPTAPAAISNADGHSYGKAGGSIFWHLGGRKAIDHEKDKASENRLQRGTRIGAPKTGGGLLGAGGWDEAHPSRTEGIRPDG